MIALETVIVAFSMFSAIPVPLIQWNERNMRWSLCAFPLVGAVIGALCAAWVWLCGALELPALLRGAGLCILPVLLTGGIHLDGYADTWDAIASRADAARRQEILKDPHLGAFAAIHLGLYFVAGLALWTALEPYRPWAVLEMFCLSRSLSGLALTVFPLRPGSGLARSFADAADKRRTSWVLGGLSLALALLLCLQRCVLPVPAAALVFLRYRRLCSREFQGLSGDLAGWFLQTAELWMLAALCLGSYVENML